MKSTLQVAFIVAAALALTGGAIAPTVKAAEGADSVIRSTTASMVVTGFDREVAEENGFEIRDIGGVQTAVPVTTAARSSEGAAARAMAAGFACGSADLIIARGVGGKIRIATAYAVYAVSVYHRWNVVGAGDTGTFTERFSGLNASTTWNATHDYQFPYGTLHGWGEVRSDSYVTLWNGALCTFSGATPYDTW
jgi:hypothetical protein